MKPTLVSSKFFRANYHIFRGFIFYREIDSETVEFYQVSPNPYVSRFIKSLQKDAEL